MIKLYWDLGGAIAREQERVGWGESVIDQIAADLRREFPGRLGFSSRNLRSMKQFYLAYADPAIWQQPVAKLTKEALQRRGISLEDSGIMNTITAVPWGQHLTILSKVASTEARFYYIAATAAYGWSRNVLINQIKGAAYENSLQGSKVHNFREVLPDHLAAQA